MSGQPVAASVLVLAAGLSSRMGAFKPLLPLGGGTVIERTVQSALDGGARRPVVVTGYRGKEVAGLLRRRWGEEVILTENPDYARTDMLASIRIGCRALPPCGAFFLLPGDMPAIRPSTFRALLSSWEARPGGVIFPTLEGYRKHPPLIDFALREEICAYRGGDGLRGFWRAHEGLIRTHPVEDAGVWLDLDTQEDYRRCLQHWNDMNRRS